MKKITYNNKQYVLNDPQYPVEETVTDTDMNEIKEVVNYNANESENVKSALINITTPKSSNINVKDSSDLNAKIDVFGISEQDGEPTPEAPVDIENVTGNIDITVCNKNWFKILSEINKTYITVNNNNTLTINGTIAQNESFAFSRIRLKKGTYTFSLGDYSKITNCYYNIRDLDTAEVIKNFNYADTTVEIDKDRNIELSFIVIAGTYNNVLIKPQVEVENKATSWVEHKEQLITFPLSEGQKMYDGDYLASDGIHHVRDVYIFKAVTSLSIYNNNNKYGTNVGAVNSINTSNILSDRIVGSDSAKENTGYITGSGYTVVIYGNQSDTVESFNEKFAGTKIEYPLAKEKIEPYTSEQQEAYNKLQNVLSYYNETNVFTDKAQLVFKYIADTKTYVDNQYNALANQVLELAGGN